MLIKVTGRTVCTIHSAIAANMPTCITTIRPVGSTLKAKFQSLLQLFSGVMLRTLEATGTVETPAKLQGKEEEAKQRRIEP